MSVDLMIDVPRGEGEIPEVRGYGPCHWRKLLQLARNFGWQPQGTVMSQITLEFYSQGREWDGDYYRSEYQCITQADGASLCDALDCALACLPDHDVLGFVKSSDFRIGIDIGHMASPEDWFSGENGKESLRDFIEFARRGQLLIA